MLTSSPLPAELTLQSRYRIVRELGRGGFGRTYLAQDINQSSQYCVLKEFAPQVQGTNELQKAKELFEREASVIYKLQHPQIPRLRELIRTSIGSNESLFLVQDYVEGQNYFELLKSYKQQGQRFSEAEVTQLLLQILPVLEYIHAHHIVHRDISPDNLIRRSSDRLPVLIDFGGVKQVAATAISLFTRLHSPTRIGKEGYAPHEQIHEGKAFPSSDLYALAVTVLVLLTGKEPQELYDTSKATWHWRQEVSVCPSLGTVLDKMLAYRPCDRYQSARGVIQALQAGDPNISQMRTLNFVGRRPAPIHQTSGSNNSRTRVIPDPAQKFIQRHWQAIATHVSTALLTRRSNNSHTRVIPDPAQKFIQRHWQAVAMGVSLALLTGISAWALVNSGVHHGQPDRSVPFPPSTPLAKAEQNRRDEIIKRSQALKISEVAFYGKVDKLFHAQHPELRGRSLTDKPEDVALRKQWYQIAENLLAQLEQNTNL